MAKGQFHVNGDGDIGVCSTTEDKCPFAEAGHYDSREATAAAYEASNADQFIPVSVSRSKFTATMAVESPKTKGFSLEAGGYYGTMPPRSIQVEALNATAEALLEDGNTQLIAACGTGKSYMGRQLMRRMMDEEDANGVAIVLTSSRKLAVDTAADLRPDAQGDYDQAIGTYGRDYEVEVIEIHSDSKDGIKSKGAVSPEKIAARWESALDEGKKVVIVSTYQSSDKVQQVQALIGERASADLLMNDEAHNVLGQRKSVSSSEEAENSGYKSFANEIPGAIQAKHRLYATATPPLADSPDDDETSAKGATREEQLESLKRQALAMKRSGKERLTVYSDDELIVGRVSGAITQQTAINNGYLTQPNYQLREAVVEGKGLTADSLVDSRGRKLTGLPEGEARPMTAQTYSAVSATLQAMTEDPKIDDEGKLRNPVHNALAYTGSIAQANAFRDNFRSVALEQSGRMSLTEAESSKDAADPELRRRARLRLLAEHGEAVAAYSGTSKEVREEREKAFTMFRGKSFTKEDAEAGWSPHKRVLANVDIFSEGISINEIDTVVISDQSKTSERAMTQAIGRSLRTVGGNEQKNTGHVIIPQVVSSEGRELNGGFVTTASYGATRVERAVSTRKLRGETVAADETTQLTHYSQQGEQRGQVLAASLAKSHIKSPEDLVTSQVLERAHNSLGAAAKTASAETRERAEHYRKLSPSEKLNAQRSFIQEQAAKQKDPSWAVAHSSLLQLSNSSVGTVRQSGKVVTSALSAGDFSAVPTAVTDKLSRAGIIRKKTGSNGPTLAEKREFVLSAAEGVATAFISKGGREAHPDLEAVLSNGVIVKEANVYAMNQGKRGKEAEFQKLVANYKSLANSSDQAVEKIYGSLEKASTDEKAPSASLSGVLRQKRGLSKEAVWSGFASLKEKVAARASREAASGSAAYELDPTMVSKNGTLTAKAQKRLAEEI